MRSGLPQGDLGGEHRSHEPGLRAGQGRERLSPVGPPPQRALGPALSLGSVLVRTAPQRLIVTGGGTGGHIFPAVALAQAFQQAYPQGKVLFVGATGGM
ncbi:MAG: glycosyltransferase, partial [Myxococcota bacterium]